MKYSLKQLASLILFSTSALTFAAHTKAECEAAEIQINQSLEQIEIQFKGKALELAQALHMCSQQQASDKCKTINEKALLALHNEQQQALEPIKNQLEQYKDCEYFDS